MNIFKKNLENFLLDHLIYNIKLKKAKLTNPLHKKLTLLLIPKTSKILNSNPSLNMNQLLNKFVIIGKKIII